MTRVLYSNTVSCDQRMTPTHAGDGATLHLFSHLAMF